MNPVLVMKRARAMIAVGWSEPISVGGKHALLSTFRASASSPEELEATLAAFERVVVPSAARCEKLSAEFIAGRAKWADAKEAISDAMREGQSWLGWLDMPGRTQSDVLKALDRAILKGRVS
jgi:hypothetical protein